MFFLMSDWFRDSVEVLDRALALDGALESVW